MILLEGVFFAFKAFEAWSQQKVPAVPDFPLLLGLSSQCEKEKRNGRRHIRIVPENPERPCETRYYYIYDKNGHRWHLSIGMANKAKTREFVLKKYRDGTLPEFRTKEMLDMAVMQRLISHNPCQEPDTEGWKMSLLHCGADRSHIPHGVGQRHGTGCLHALCHYRNEDG